MPGKGQVVVTVPPQTHLQVPAEVPCSIEGVANSEKCTVIDKQTISFKLPEGAQMFATGTYMVVFEGVFHAPLSSKPTDPFKVSVQDATGNELAKDGS